MRLKNKSLRKRRAAPKHPALIAHAEQRSSTFHNRLADTLTEWVGSMSFVYLHAVVFALWIGAEPFGDAFPYGLLTMIVSLEAIFLSSFVMISQNRSDERRTAIENHQWELVQLEERQNEQLLDVSGQVLRLTKEVHQLVSRVHHALHPDPDESESEVDPRRKAKEDPH